MKPIIILSSSEKYSTAIQSIFKNKFKPNYEIVNGATFEKYFMDEKFHETVYLVILDTAQNDYYDCYAVIQKLKSSSKTFEIPIFIISTVYSQKEKMKALSLNINEYLIFPVTVNEVTLKCGQLIDNYLETKNFRDGILLYSSLKKEISEIAQHTQEELDGLIAAHEAVFQLSRQELLEANNKLKENYEAKLSALKEKGELQMLFGKYISPDVIDFIMHKDGTKRLSGEKKDITVLFSDIRGFTSISETVDPAKVVILLNEFFTELTETIIKHHGIIDKYTGDNIMAVFGAPLELKDHHEWALLAAIEMQKKFAIIQEKWKELYHIDAGMGIGINSGTTIVGSIGSYHKLSYTAIGDTVNIAARFEQIALDKQIVLGEKLKERISKNFLAENNLIINSLGKVTLKGKSGSHHIYNISHK